MFYEIPGGAIQLFHIHFFNPVWFINFIIQLSKNKFRCKREIIIKTKVVEVLFLRVIVSVVDQKIDT